MDLVIVQLTKECILAILPVEPTHTNIMHSDIVNALGLSLAGDDTV